MMKPTTRENNPNTVKLEVESPVGQRFSLRYLNLFSKAATLSPWVNLQMKSETPITVKFEIEKLGELKFYLAPKISEEEITGSP
jgi:proliferating cell nuclear antigen